MTRALRALAAIKFTAERKGKSDAYPILRKVDTLA